MATRQRKKDITPSEIRKVQKRQFKSICSRVDKHVQEFKTPVIMMGVINGTLSFCGSEQLKKKFCKDTEVQRKFMDIASTHNSEKLLQSHGTKGSTSDVISENEEPLSFIDLENATYRFLRCFIAQAVQNSQGSVKALYLEDKRPPWWLPEVPFISPNHPPQGMESLHFEKLMALAQSYQTFIMAKSDQTADGMAISMSQLPQFEDNEMKILSDEDALLCLEKAEDIEQFLGALRSVPEDLVTLQSNSFTVPEISICTDVFSCLSSCLNDISSSRLRLCAVNFGALHFEEFVMKLDEISPATRHHVLLHLASWPTQTQCKDTKLHIFQELKALTRKDTYPGVFHLILLAGAMNICIHQKDRLARRKFHNVPLVYSPTANMQSGILWQTMTEATPYNVVGAMEDSSISAKESWILLISACENTCKMEPYGQCVSNQISGKQKVDWVQCTACETWLHCIWAGLCKQELSGSQFLCCMSVCPENNFRVIDNLFFKDIHSLYPTHGLSDAAINFYIRELLPCSRSVVVVSPLLYQGIQEAVTTDNPDARFESLWQALCRNEQIHHKELIAFSCNLLPLQWHWILVVVRIKDFSAWTLDSLGMVHHERVTSIISCFLSFVTKKTISLASKPLKVAEQRGGYDCGIHVLHNLELTIKLADQFEAMEKISDETIDCSFIRGKTLAAFYNKFVLTKVCNPELRQSNRSKKQLNSHPPNIEDLLKDQNEDGLKVAHFPGKGRGVVTTKPFKKDAFICEYVGKVLTFSAAKQMELNYEQQTDVGCYMFYFKHKSRTLCIDATAEDGRMGRLINHSAIQANVIPKVVEVKAAKVSLYCKALRDIECGEELMYDYGERNIDIVKANPWLRN